MLAIAEVMIDANPVSETTPMIIPTTAQAIITESACCAPLASASTTSLTDILVVFLSIATTTVSASV